MLCKFRAAHTKKTENCKSTTTFKIFCQTNLHTLGKLQHNELNSQAKTSQIFRFIRFSLHSSCLVSCISRSQCQLLALSRRQEKSIKLLNLLLYS